MLKVAIAGYRKADHIALVHLSRATVESNSKRIDHSTEKIGKFEAFLDRETIVRYLNMHDCINDRGCIWVSSICLAADTDRNEKEGVSNK
ncbi:hypothetical protein [Teredinibacter waterburyi]|jgi:hypothetical protein|uniref:hypothetical protein n=1 Tax=Teredinibacter waterburyi TaxID=1500538 RepID=UPI00165F5022|nr:hypothetical protein [Teredinibacter waterburyi]